MRQCERRIDRIDAADEIVVLRRLDERRQLLASERNEDAARRRAEARMASSTSAASVQRSPATAIHGGRRRAKNATPAARAAFAALAEMTAA